MLYVKRTLALTDWQIPDRAQIRDSQIDRVERAAEHGIEKVGEKLRAMMPWISAHRLVDKSKN